MSTSLRNELRSMSLEQAKRLAKQYGDTVFISYYLIVQIQDIWPGVNSPNFFNKEAMEDAKENPDKYGDLDLMYMQDKDKYLELFCSDLKKGKYLWDFFHVTSANRNLPGSLREDHSRWVYEGIMPPPSDILTLGWHAADDVEDSEGWRDTLGYLHDVEDELLDYMETNYPELAE